MTPNLSHLFDDRWEQDRLQHYYYLETPAYQKLSTVAKHVIVKGHRGTGKTTLLRALDWRERLSNPNLRRSLQEDPFADHVIGCFLQIKLLPVDMIDIWLRDSNAQVKHAVISTYLRASWMIEISAAVAGLNAEYSFARYADQVADLSHIAEDFWKWMPPRLNLSPALDEYTLTLLDVRSAAETLMRDLRSAAAIELPSAEAAVVQYDLLGVTSLFSRIFDALSNHVGRIDDATWAFRICMDEGEFLSPEWEHTVRTLIRETDAPIYLALSVLNTFGSETRTRGTSISIDDREVVDLDSRTADQMADLLDGVLKARLRLLNYNRRFDLRQFLGNPDVEELARYAIRRSETKAALALREGGGLDPDKSLVRQHLERTGAIPVEADRRSESAGYRKKKVAGYLHFLGTVGIDRPIYAGWRIAVNAADNSVRDFIRFLRYSTELSVQREELSADEIERFLRRKNLDVLTQDRALQMLGSRKMESMPDTVVNPSQTGALVKLFGEWSHRIDFYGDPKVKRPNAARITFSLSELDAQQRKLLIALLDEAAAYGFIADLEFNSATLGCRVNRSLARFMGFSYWKPQYRSRISHYSVKRALENPRGPVSSWLSIRGDHNRRLSQPALFDWAEQEDEGPQV